VTQEPPPGAVEPPPADERRAFQIFINYRREDTAGHAGRLYDELARRFGEDHVFIDVDAIDPGQDFTQAVEQSVGSCDVLLALIGRTWVTTADHEGRRRLDKPKDWVRVEIQTALDRPETRVIPTLVQGAQMPTSDDLPQELQKLSDRNAFEIRDNRWRADVQRLIADLEALARERAGAGGWRTWARSRWFVPALVGAALLVLAGVLAAVLFSGGSGSGDRAVSRYVGLIDARLTTSADTKGDLNDLIGDVRNRDVPKPLSRELALERIDAIIRQRRGLLDDLEPFEVPPEFRQTHELLRTSVTRSLEDDLAVKKWMQAFYNGSPNEQDLFAEVGRLSTIATQQKQQFLTEYNDLREEKLDLSPTNPSY
jgi:TIR domain-containing protein